jgi:predicted ferric reductase
MPDELTWYITRSSGLVAWALMAVATLWGLLLVSRVLERRPSPIWLLDLHRHLSALTVALTAVHIGALWSDDFIEFSATEILVPLTSDHETLAVGLGVAALWVLAIVEISGRLRSRLPLRVWRSLHVLSGILVVLATLHGVMIGTDLGHPVVVVVGLVLAAEVLLVLGLRVSGGRRPVPLAPTTG